MTWDDIRRYAFGTLRLLPNEFYEMTYGEYCALAEGFELARQQEVAIYRQLFAAVVQSNGAKVTPMQLLPLPMVDSTANDDRAAIIEKTLNLARQLKAKRNGRTQGQANG